MELFDELSLENLTKYMKNMFLNMTILSYVIKVIDRLKCPHYETYCQT